MAPKYGRRLGNRQVSMPVTKTEELKQGKGLVLVNLNFNSWNVVFTQNHKYKQHATKRH